MTPEIILNVVLVLVSMGGIVALGLWALDGMMDDDPHDKRFYGDKTSKPPSEH